MHDHGHCQVSQHLVRLSVCAFKQHSVTVYTASLTLQENCFGFVNAIVLGLVGENILILLKEE